MGSSTAILCCSRGRRPRQFALFGELELIARLRARAVERLANVCRFRVAQDGEELRERPKTRSPYERSLAFAWDDGREGSFPCGSQTRLQDAAIASRETKWLTELLRLPRQKLCIVWQRVRHVARKRSASALPRC